MAPPSLIALVALLELGRFLPIADRAEIALGPLRPDPAWLNEISRLASLADNARGIRITNLLDVAILIFLWQ